MADPDYFTLVEFKALPDCSDFDDSRILAAAAYFTSIVESELGAPLIERSYTEVTDGMDMRTVILMRPYVTSIDAVTVDGTTVAVNRLNIDPTGRLRYTDGTTRWSGVGIGNVSVTYTAGMYEECPPDVKDAVMWATRDRLIAQAQESGSWDRKSSETSEFGTVNYVLAGVNRPTGYPDLDAVIASRQRSLGPAAG